MKKTYLVTVEIFPEQAILFGKDDPADQIVNALRRNGFLHNPEVILAPDSIQPINIIEGNN